MLASYNEDTDKVVEQAKHDKAALENVSFLIISATIAIVAE